MVRGASLSSPAVEDVDTAAAVAQARRWAVQRLASLVLLACVLVHLAVMVYAVRGGLSAAELLGRTRGSWGFGAFYLVFLAACVLHVPPGLATIAEEWLGWSRRVALFASCAFALLLLVLGLRAVWGMVWA